jgi:PPOX class probable F420-dependent enzyme
MIDLTSEFGKHVARRLAEEQVIWLTTTDSSRTPQPRPVWFLWNGESILVFSQTGAYKIAHIKKHPRVSLNFNSDKYGEDIVVILGNAQIVDSTVPEEEITAYLTKYHQGLKRIEMSVEDFVNSYNTAIRITPRKLRGF